MMWVPATHSGNSSVGRASAFQAEGRGFESRFPLCHCVLWSRNAHVAQAVEHFLGKEEVIGSSPIVGSFPFIDLRFQQCCFLELRTFLTQRGLS